MNLPKSIKQLVVIGALLASVLPCFAQQVTLPPQSFQSREQVKINVTTTAPFALGRESVTMSGNVITVIVRSYNEPAGPGPFPPAIYTPATNADVILGYLPQGVYGVQVFFRNLVSGPDVTVGNVQINIKDDVVDRSAAYPIYNYTDLWWNPAESGWGISIHVKNDKFFGAWFVYDSAGKAIWYTMQAGRWTSSNQYVAPIYETQSNANAGVGTLSTLTIKQVGTGTITFNGTDQADFYYEVNALQNRKTIVRQVF